MMSSEAKNEVFVIEDDHEFREIVCWALRKEGLFAHSFDSPHSALSVLEKGTVIPSLIIVDFHMDGMQGSDFLLAKEKLPNLRIKNCPAILMTASIEEIRTLGLKLNSVDFLAKPVDLGVLLDLVKEKISGAL